MTVSNFPWQTDDWHQLQLMLPRLPHALLLHGADGIGKTAFAQHFAQALLCEQPDADGHACGTCASCGWFAQGNHPDYRCIRPQALETAADEASSADDEARNAKTTRAPSRDIRIDQVRALAAFLNVSTHRHGRRVVLLYPAETLNPAAANALLKMLEEPPPATVFLLVSSNPDRLLPTIRSRCRRFALRLPTPVQAFDWLHQQQVAQAQTWLAEQGGAPLAARDAARNGEPQLRAAFLQQLAQPQLAATLQLAEQLQKTPLPQLVAWLQRWLYDLMSLQLAGVVRYYPEQRAELQALAARTDGRRLAQALQRVTERGAIARHPLSARLFVEDMLLDYMSIFC